MMCWIAALQAIGQTAPKPSPQEVLKCLGLDGKACTWMQVTDLTAAAASAESTHTGLATFAKLTLTSFDGTLKCEQIDGTACTADRYGL